MWEWACPRWRFVGGRIRDLGNGDLGFRPYGGSLWKSRNVGPAQSNQRALAPPLGTSPRLGVPEIKIKSQSQSKSQSKSR